MGKKKGYLDHPLTKRRRPRKSGTKDKGKVKNIVDTTVKTETIYQRKIRVWFQEDCDAGVAIRREANGSWWRFGCRAAP